MQSAWILTGIMVPAICSLGAALMFGPSAATHWAACFAFLLAAVWMGAMGVMWFRKTPNRDWTVWLKTAGIAAFIFLFTPLMIYFAWPAGAQVPPGGVTGNCNNFGNNNFNCNTLNLGPGKRSLSDPDARQFKQTLLQLPKDKPVYVGATQVREGNLEFADEIYSFLKTNGYSMKNDNANVVVIPQPPKGITYQILDSEVYIIVGY